MDSLFLMQQMALREELESIPGSEDPAAELNNMCLEVKVATEALFQTFIGDYQESTDQSLQHAREVVKKLQFMHKLQRELDNLEDQLAGY
jgi:molecular chaperone HscB